MKALPEATLFLSAAAGLHLLAFSLLSAPTGSAGAAGDGGEALITLAAAPARIAALIDAWETPPQVTPDTPALHAPEQPHPDTPQATPDQTRPTLPSAPGLPQTDSTRAPALDTSPAKPQPAPKPQAKPQPKPKPAAKPQSKPSAPSAAQKSAGQGQTGAAGAAKTQSPSLSKSQARSLTAQWAGQILSRIERKKRFPPSARGRSGAVSLTLTVTANGTLQSAQVSRSSGHAALDGAAMQAVQRAGRFPAAPAALGKGPFRLTLKIRFSG